MNMNWKAKSLAFHCIDTLALNKTLYFLQKNVTRRSRIDMAEGYKHWLVHEHNLATLVRPNIFEFGAGKHLGQNIYLSQFVGAQTVVDLFPMLDMGQVNEAAAQISARYPSIPCRRMVDISDIERNYGIRYLAPFDASRTLFDDNTFDGCISTDTLEHIPQDAIFALFRELRRITRPDGLISAVIDYSDHYAYSDKNIGPLNYLQYSTDEFKRYNHRVHFQNRLRHFDYARIFASLGYECISSEAQEIAVPPSRISPEFDESQASLFAQRGTFLLLNAKPSE